MSVILSLAFAAGVSVGSTTVQCGQPKEARTPFVRSATGFAVSLHYRGDDDHFKGIHNCLSEYELEIVRPDGSRAETGWDDGNDDEWNRSISYRVEGFSADGQRAVAVMSEGGRHYPMLEVVVYDLKTLSYESSSPDAVFLRKIGPACLRSLHVQALTNRGEPVLGTSDTDACTARAVWRVTTRLTRRGTNIVETLPPGTPLKMLQSGSTTHDAGH